LKIIEKLNDINNTLSDMRFELEFLKNEIRTLKSNSYPITYPYPYPNQITYLSNDTKLLDNKKNVYKLLSIFMDNYYPLLTPTAIHTIEDIPNLKKHGYPIWYLGATPLGCFNIPVVLDKETEQKIKQKREYLENGILTCDDSGCTLIEKEPNIFLQFY
jgi:hypothetical protein